MKKTKVLVLGWSNSIGGIETFYMTYFNKIEKDKLKIDFASIYPTIAFEKEIKKSGSKIYQLSNFKKHPLKYQKELKKILLENHYDIVHVHMLSAANILPLKIASQCNVKKVIAHCHNSNIPTGLTRKIMHTFNKRKIKKYANEFVACSHMAGQWLFNDQPFITLNNAVDTKKFKFNKKAREEIRTRYKIKVDDFVMGHIGRFCEQKNQEFLVDLFYEYQKKDKSAKLILIGSGETQENVKKQIEKLQIKDKVIIINNTPEIRQEIEKYYSAFDLFVLPSRFEGLPVVGIEAQANGIPCLFSDRISKEVALNKNVTFLSIDHKEEWIQAIKNQKRCRKPLLKENGYSIEENKIQLEKLYH